ncbi:integrase arm-type DNA-binding domain-containing protein [Pseudomonas sp. UMAB-40]|uniref:tyrosine-type recombinase/integrase n=1 Tax=Pseudomonas sp. UMAB-40 TaxID=1365407 RepID=UPI001C598AD6|nr:integrase arm-type DNA-binding domain-containing protein [Pseudomonas sp. UMAB-40]
MALTQKAIQNITIPATYQDKNGLFLKVSPTGAKSWTFRYQLNGKRHDKGLGSFPLVSLADARAACLELRVQINNGIDPLEEKRQQAKKTITFQDEALERIERYKHGWSEKHAAQWFSSLRDHVFPIIGLMPVEDVDTDAVVSVLDPIWRELPESARRVRNRIELVLDFAKTRGNRSGDNPARWRGHLQNILSRTIPEPTHLESMPYSRLPNFMEKLEGDVTRAARCLQFVILTACRSGEAMGAEWDEIDFETKTWNIPAARMKNRQEHQIPLSDAAMTVLKDVHTRGKSKYIFPNRSLEAIMPNNAMRRVLIRYGESSTPHGFRSTFRTWAAEKTKFPSDLCEVALSHAVGNATTRSYNRGNLLERRRPLMDRWAKYVMERSIAPSYIEKRAAPRQPMASAHA